MKKIVFGTVVVALIAFILYSWPIEKLQNQQPVNSAKKNLTNKPSIIQQQLAKKIADIIELENKSLPRMVDNVTRLDKVTAGSATQIIYSYTLPNYAASAVSSDWVASAGKAKVTKGVCTDIELKPLLLSGVSLIYVYKGNDDVYINQFQVSKPDCHTVN